ncbi:MAG: hypothetical protein WC763_06325 [Candidatus Paceibacterota bacterium]|jgi:hypothetical protein
MDDLSPMDIAARGYIGKKVKAQRMKSSAKSNAEENIKTALTRIKIWLVQRNALCCRVPLAGMEGELYPTFTFCYVFKPLEVAELAEALARQPHYYAQVSYHRMLLESLGDEVQARIPLGHVLCRIIFQMIRADRRMLKANFSIKKNPPARKVPKYVNDNAARDATGFQDEDLDDGGGGDGDDDDDDGEDGDGENAGEGGGGGANAMANVRRAARHEAIISKFTKTEAYGKAGKAGGKNDGISRFFERLNALAFNRVRQANEDATSLLTIDMTDFDSLLTAAVHSVTDAQLKAHRDYVLSPFESSAAARNGHGIEGVFVDGEITTANEQWSWIIQQVTNYKLMVDNRERIVSDIKKRVNEEDLDPERILASAFVAKPVGPGARAYWQSQCTSQAVKDASEAAVDVIRALPHAHLDFYDQGFDKRIVRVPCDDISPGMSTQVIYSGAMPKGKPTVIKWDTLAVAIKDALFQHYPDIAGQPASVAGLALLDNAIVNELMQNIVRQATSKCIVEMQTPTTKLSFKTDEAEAPAEVLMVRDG